MSTQPRIKLSRQAAERLLTAPQPGTGTVQGSLAGLVAAATIPAGQRELSGEAGAVAAFRAAHLAPAANPRRRPLMSATKLLAVKTIMAAVGVTASGGFALAAATGHIPAALGGHAGTHPTAPATPSGSGPRPAASPSPDLKGLCNAYSKGVAGSAGKALDTPAFGALITAAGGKANVAAYCAALPANGNSEDHTPSAHPTGKPSAHPTAHPTPTHPGPPHTMPPTGPPTPAPTSHPHP